MLLLFTEGILGLVLIFLVISMMGGNNNTSGSTTTLEELAALGVNTTDIDPTLLASLDKNAILASQGITP
jgi:hypothetical protein